MASSVCFVGILLTVVFVGMTSSSSLDLSVAFEVFEQELAEAPIELSFVVSHAGWVITSTGVVVTLHTTNGSLLAEDTLADDVLEPLDNLTVSHGQELPPHLAQFRDRMTIQCGDSEIPVRGCEVGSACVVPPFRDLSNWMTYGTCANAEESGAVDPCDASTLTLVVPLGMTISTQKSDRRGGLVFFSRQHVEGVDTSTFSECTLEMEEGILHVEAGQVNPGPYTMMPAVPNEEPAICHMHVAHHVTTDLLQLALQTYGHLTQGTPDVANCAAELSADGCQPYTSQMASMFFTREILACRTHAEQGGSTLQQESEVQCPSVSQKKRAERVARRRWRQRYTGATQFRPRQAEPNIRWGGLFGNKK